MRNCVGKIIIYNYQMEDIINILLINNYYVEIQKYNNDKIQICIYGYKLNVQESEDNNGKDQ